MAKNVLILSAAAKVILLQSFQSVLRPLGRKVYSGDIDKNCASACFSDGHIVLPPTNQEEFIDFLLDRCAELGIYLIIPTRDGELEVLSKHMDKFFQIGTLVLCPSPHALEKVQNKREFNKELSKIGLRGIPEFETYDKSNLPLFLRPIVGAGGNGILKVDNWEDLPKNIDQAATMVTPFIAKPEYTIDLLMDIKGEKALCAIPRERNKISAGESRITTTRDIHELSKNALKIGEHFGLVGHNTLQAFYCGHEEPYFIEVNPRFGGASNCSIVAGLDSPTRIIKMLDNDPSAYSEFNIKYGVQMHRYSQDLFFNV